MVCIDCLETHYVRILPLERDLTSLHSEHYVEELSFVFIVALTDAVEELLRIVIRKVLLLKSERVVWLNFDNTLLLVFSIN